MYILHILHIVCNSIWLLWHRLDVCQSTIIYEPRKSAQVLYVTLLSPILALLFLVPVGDTAIIPGPYPSGRAENQLTVGVIFSIKQKAHAATDAGGGTCTVEPWEGGQSNDWVKKHLKVFVCIEWAKYVIMFRIWKIFNTHNMQSISIIGTILRIFKQKI